jgi:hypothetical protein
MPAPISPLFTSEEENRRRAAVENPQLLQFSKIWHDTIQSLIDHPSQMFSGLGGVPQPIAPTAPGTSDVTAAMLGTAGSWIDSWLEGKTPPTRQIQQTLDPAYMPFVQAPPEMTPVAPGEYPKFAPAMEEVGRSIPRTMAQVGLMATGNPAAYVGALADTAVSTYAQTEDPIASLLAPATMATMGKVIPIAGRLGERAAASAFTPAFEQLVQAPATKQAYGTMVKEMLQPNALTQNAITAGRIGAENVAGVATGEATRMVGEALHGQDVQVFDPVSIATNVVQNIAFAPLDIATRRDPAAVQQEVALSKIAQADVARQRIAAENDTRGARIAETHRKMLDAVRNGQDPTALVDELQRHWTEAQVASSEGTSPAQAILMSMSRDADAGRLSEADVVQLTNGVMGRLDELAKSDPSSSLPGTISGKAYAQLVELGLAPKITEEFLRTNYREAYDQMLGDGPAARANLLNRIVGHIQELAPEALKAREKLPVAKEDQTKAKLQAWTEAEKDTLYMQSLLKLYPAMKGKKAPDGTPLDEALWMRDALMSAETGGSQLDAADRAVSRYSKWKDQMIAFVDSFDPVTGKGSWTPSKWMADRTLKSKEPVSMTIEELVDWEPVGKKGRRYKVQSSAVGKATQSKMSLLGRMLALGEERFDRAENVDPSDFEAAQDMRTQMESSVEAARKSGEVEQTAQMPKPENLTGVDQPVIGDLKTNEPAYDAALEIVNKIERLSDEELWQKYGGEKVFGRGATATGKKELFKLALLAKMEYDADDTGRITESQQKFVEEWRKFADEKGATAKPVEGWREMRQQVRHALRLYFRQQTDSDMKNLFVSLLDDKPQYQEILTGRKQSLPAQSESTPNTDGTYQPFGQTDPLQDTLRMFHGYAKRFGADEGYAAEYAVTAGKLVQALNEASAVGRLVGDDPLWGANIPAQTMKDRPWIGINFDQIDKSEVTPMSKAVRGLQILAHELTHNYSTVNRIADYPSAYRQQRLDAHAKMQALFDDIGPEGADFLLNKVIRDVFVPPAFRSRYESQIAGSANFSDEAVSKLMEYTLLGAFTKNNPYQSIAKQSGETFGEAFNWLPDDVQAFVRLAFRDVSNFVGGVEEYYRTGRPHDPDAQKVLAYLRPMMKFSNDFIGQSVKLQQSYEAIAKRTLAGMEVAGTVDWADPVIVKTAYDLDTHELKRIAETNKVAFAQMRDSGEDPFGFQEVQTQLFGPKEMKSGKILLEHEKRLGRQTPAWSHWLGLLYQNMERYRKAGVQLAEPAAYMLGELEPAYWRLTQRLHSPFVITDAKGNIKYDPDHPVQVILQNKHPQAKRGFDAMRDIALWMQETGKPVFEGDQLSADAQPVFAKALRGLDPQVQQGVQEGLKSLVKGYQEAADLKYESSKQTIASNVAKFFMVADKSMAWNHAFSQAQVAVDGAVNLHFAQANLTQAQEVLTKVQKRVQAQPELMQSPDMQNAQRAVQQAMQTFNQRKQEYVVSLEGLTPEQVAVLEQYVGGPDGPAEKLVQMRQLFDQHAGWYMSETRPGRFKIFAKTADGKKYASSQPTRALAEQRLKQLQKAGMTELNIVDRDVADAKRLFDSPDEVINSFIKLEQGSWQKFLKTVEGKLSEEDYASLAQDIYTPGEAAQRFVTNRSMERFMKERKLVAGREELNPFEVFTDYTQRLVGNVARRGLREQMELLLRDPRARNNGEFVATVREAMDTMMQPVNSQFMTARTAINAFFLGLPNIGSPLVESSQALTTVLPNLVAETGSFSRAVKLFSNAPVEIFKYSRARDDLHVRQLIESGKRKEASDPRLMTKEESKAYYYRRALDERRFHQIPIESGFLSRDHALLTQYAFGMGMGDVAPKNPGKLAENVVYWMSQTMMWPYSQLSAMNNRVAFMAGLDYYYDQGYRGQVLYQKAHLFKDRATFGGGKANEIGYVGKLSNPRTRSWFSLVNTLQRYSFGYTTMLKDLTADVIGRTNLPPPQRVAATKALTTALATQTVLAGAIGIPGAAIAAAVMQELLGVDLKQRAREGWFELSKALGADDPTAVMLANVAQNGVGGHFMGMDLSSRLSVNTFLGFDAYEGFNTTNLLGAGAGIVEGLINGTKYVAQGKEVQAAQSMLPPSWKPLIDMAAQTVEHGEVGVRGPDGRLIAPMTTGEKFRYGMGIRPYSLRLFRDQQQALKNANLAVQQVREQRVDTAADALVKGDSSKAFDWIRETVAQSPTASPQTMMQSVIDRAIVQQNAQDLLSQVPLENADRARAIARTFGDAVPRQSEVDLLMQREKLKAQTGFVAGKPADAKAVTKAALIDALVREQGMTRTEALRLVTVMGY